MPKFPDTVAHHKEDRSKIEKVDKRTFPFAEIRIKNEVDKQYGNVVSFLIYGEDDKTKATYHISFSNPKSSVGYEISFLEESGRENLVLLSELNDTDVILNIIVPLIDRIKSYPDDSNFYDSHFYGDLQNYTYSLITNLESKTE